MTKAEKMEFIDERINFYKKEIEALERIKNGEPEAKVLRDLNINQRNFRYRNYKAISNNTYKEDKEYWNDNDLFLSPEEKLFCDVTKEETDLTHIPYTIKENVDEVLSTFPEGMEKQIIKMLYFEGYSMSEIGKNLNITNEHVRVIKEKALRRLRHPSRVNILKRNITTEELSKIRISNELTKEISELINIAKDAKDAISKSIFNLNNNNKELSNMAFNETPIEGLKLSARSYNCLKRVDIRTVGDIFKISNSLSRIRNIGERGYEEVIKKLSEYLNINIESLYKYFGEFQYPNHEPVIYVS